METKWTKGPWAAIVSGEVRVFGSGFAVCQLTGGEIQRNTANANLIAAAPDMYHALVVLANVAESRGIPVDAARAAMAKARGETP